MELLPGAKRLVIFLDGTWNVANDNTNVWRLHRLCRTNEQQVIYYSPGVGTQVGEKILGGAIGYGIDEEVMQAYDWLVDHYNENDQIFIFGFSRGAYTARSLSGLILKCGLMRPGAPILTKDIYARYRLNDAVQDIQHLKDAEKNGKFDTLTREEQWLLRYCFAPAIRFLGVWDTVGSLGISVGDISEISKDSYRFLETDLRRNNDYAFHALAIDEHRPQFEPTLWMKKKTNTYPDRPWDQVEQRWFIGAHSNVGGGYESDLLAQRPLKWLMDKASKLGLQFRDDVQLNQDIDSASINDSYAEFLEGIYKVLPLSKRFYRPIGASPFFAGTPDEAVTINESIDSSVFKRWREDQKYQKNSENLASWLKNCGLPIEQLSQSVKARSPFDIVPD